VIETGARRGIRHRNEIPSPTCGLLRRQSLQHTGDQDLKFGKVGTNTIYTALEMSQLSNMSTELQGTNT
jgi:hypothetical protein